jgi:hypothetical protein
MRACFWLRAAVCGAAFCVGGLLGIESLRAAEESPLPNDEKHAAASPEKESSDDTNRSAESKSERDEPKESDQRQKTPSSQSANLKSPIAIFKDEVPSSEQAAAAALLGRLSPEHMKSLGTMLDEDWKNRPEWGDMAVAIMKGDYMRPNVGWWKPGAKRYDWPWLRERYDANKDDKVIRDEFPNDLLQADKQFERLDRDRDGQLAAADFDYSESLADKMASMSNQLFNRIDKDSNGQITLDEMATFFLVADKEELGFLTPEDLRFAIDAPTPINPVGKEAMEKRASAGPSTPADAMRLFLHSELGWFGSGPQLDDAAPDFTLPTHDRKAVVKLSDSFGKRPVVLVFGSFT